MTDSATHTPTAPPGDRSKVDQVRQGATHAAHDVRDEVSGAVTDVKGEASAQISNVRDEAMSHANHLVHETRRQVRDQADQGTHQFAEALVSAGRELTAMADRSEQPDGPMTGLVRQIGERATSMGQRFQEGGYRALAGDTSGFARQSPGMFLLAAAGAGFAVGRLVKNADTGALARAAREGGGGGGDGQPEGDGHRSVGSTGSQWTQPSLDATSAIPADVDLRQPPGIGADELTGLVAGGASPAGRGGDGYEGEVR